MAIFHAMTFRWAGQIGDVLDSFSQRHFTRHTPAYALAGRRIASLEKVERSIRLRRSQTMAHIDVLPYTYSYND